MERTTKGGADGRCKDAPRNGTTTERFRFRPRDDLGATAKLPRAVSSQQRAQRLASQALAQDHISPDAQRAVSTSSYTIHPSYVSALLLRL